MKRFIKSYWPHIVFISVLFLLILTIYKDYGIAWDEMKMIVIGKHYVLMFFGLFGIHPSNLIDNIAYFFPGNLPVHLKGHGVIYDVATFLIVLLTQNFSLEMFHLVRGIFSIVIFILISIIANRIVNKRAGFFAMLFLLVFPRFFGDIFTNPLDMPVVFFIASSIAFFLYFLKTKRSVPKMIFFSLLLGITANQRLLMGYFVVLTLLFLIIYDKYIQKKSFSQLTRQVSAIVIMTLFFMTVTHPWLLTHPLTGIFDFIKSAKQYPWTADVLFGGRFIKSIDLPWYYLPKSMLITTPLFILALFFLGFIQIIRYMKKKYSSLEKKLIYSYILFIFIIPVGMAVIIHPILYDSWRHFLFLTIPLIIISVIGLDSLLSLKKKSVRILVLFLVIFNVFLTIHEMVALHPYEYIYYNSLVGGLKGAYTKYETDYWGLGYKEAVEWFNMNVNKPNEKYKIFSEGDKLSSVNYFKKNMIFTDDPKSADYIITFTRWNFHKRLPGVAIHAISREGIPLIYIKKIVGVPGETIGLYQ